jgi:hypothetical protein
LGDLGIYEDLKTYKFFYWHRVLAHSELFLRKLKYKSIIKNIQDKIQEINKT